jgi:hypothetical protein
MAYSELIKSFERIRDYMRDFYVYGFKSRDEYDMKSARSYDNERRRMESWLGEYMSFRQDASGKNVFISMDSRQIAHNPLHKAWKAKSFTKNDLSLHFLLLDILSADKAMTISQILDEMTSCLTCFQNPEAPDESTVRKKLREYCEVGLLDAEKQGRQMAYKLASDGVHLSSWRDAVTFFAEADPMGVIGSFLLDKLREVPGCYSFKHNYMLYALDSGVQLDLLLAIGEHRRAEIEIVSRRMSLLKKIVVVPLKIFVSVQGGRQYVAAYNPRYKKLMFYRLDIIKSVTAGDVEPQYLIYHGYLDKYRLNLWGVSPGSPFSLDHIEMTVSVSIDEHYIADRLKREKRCGTVEQVGDTVWQFSADVYDAGEMLPWIRTFTGRILSLTCSNPSVEQTFKADLDAMCLIYGGDRGAL